MTRSSQPPNEQEPNGDPATQFALPYVDVSHKFFLGLNPEEILMYAPAGLFLLLCPLLIISGSIGLGFLSLLGGLVLILLAKWTIIKSKWWSTPRQSLKNTISFVLLQRSMPWDHEVVVEKQEHGIKRIFADGTAEMVDGRLVGIIKVDGRNMWGMDNSQLGRAINDFADGIDDEIRDFDFDFYSTTRRPDADSVTSVYENRALEMMRGENNLLREVLFDIADWYRSVDEPSWDAREWNHYVITWVSPREVQLEMHGRKSLWEELSPFSDSIDQMKNRRVMQNVLDERLQTLEQKVLGSTDGLDARRITADEHACLQLAYWSGEDHSPDEEFQLLQQKTITGPSTWLNPRTYQNPKRDDVVVDPERGDEPGNTLARDRVLGAPASPSSYQSGFGAYGQQNEAATDGGVESVDMSSSAGLAPSQFDVQKGYLEVGSQYCRSIWIAEWPMIVNSLPFEGLYTMDGVDLDVCISVRAEEKQSVLSELERVRARIGAEQDERFEVGNPTAEDIQSEADVYQAYYNLIRTTNTESWRINGFVNVRAGPQKAIEDARNSLMEHSSLDAAKMDSLNKATKRVMKALEGDPASTTPVVVNTKQRELFTSCSPTGRDLYNETSGGEMSTRVPGDTVGSLFPPCSTDLFEEDGIDWGRSQHTGLPIRANPFERGAAGHMITLGQSGSGKTYSATKAAARWYATGDDRTLIVCDTKGEFEGLTNLLDGEHIVVDGTKGINPLEINAVPEHLRDSLQGKDNPLSMKIEEAQQFFGGILRSQEVDPSGFMSTIEEALQLTYYRSGIIADDWDSHELESPTVRDFLITLNDMAEEGAEYTHFGNDREGDIKAEKAAELLDLLSAFKDHGKYSYLLGETETKILDPEVDMIYVDLRQLQFQHDAEKSSMLNLMLGQVGQKVKQDSGQLIFMIDEAHFLLHNDKMRGWLEKSAREWRKYNSCMWLISQSPHEFVSSSSDSDSKKNIITAQSSTIQLFRTPRADLDLLKKFGLNDAQAKRVKSKLKTGSSGIGYSECLMSFQGEEGWIPCRVEASDLEDLCYTFSAKEHGDWESYIEEQWGGI